MSQNVAYSDGSDQQNTGDKNPQGSSSDDSHGLADFYLRRQCRHILSDLVVGDFSVDLGRGNTFLSEHLADRFQRVRPTQAQPS